MPEFICEKCKQVFPSQRNLDRHLDKKKPCKPIADYKEHCKKCRKGFDDAHGRWAHEQICKGAKATLSDAQARIKLLEAKLQESLRQTALIDEPEFDESDINIDSSPGWDRPETKICRIGDIDTFRPQIYFIHPGPCLLPFQKVSGHPIKFGYSNAPFERVRHHEKDFGGVKVIDSLIVDRPFETEKLLKQFLRWEDNLIPCKSSKKKSVETEVFIVQDQTDYEKIYRKAQEIGRLTSDEARSRIEIQKELIELREDFDKLKQNVTR